MNICISIILLLFVTYTSWAQVNIHGTVIDREANEPLAGASVIVKSADGKIKKFASTKTDGTFAIQVLSVTGYRLELAMMGFAKQSLPLDSISFP